MQHVPVQCVERRHAAVGKAMHHLQAEALAVERADQAAAALGAQVDGQDLGGHIVSPVV